MSSASIDLSSNIDFNYSSHSQDGGIIATTTTSINTNSNTNTDTNTNACYLPPVDLSQVVAAVQYGDLDRLRESFDRGAAVPDLKDGEDCSLLHWAAINNRISIIRFLLSSGADPNIIGGNLRETPLQWASRHDNFVFSVFVLISEGGASFRQKNVHGHDALFLACQHSSQKIAYLLLQLGADPNTVDAAGDTPLLWLSKHAIHTIHPSPCSFEIFRLLVKHGANPLAVDIAGNNMLHIACFAGSKVVNFKIIFDIFKSNRSSLYSLLWAKNSAGQSPLDIAYQNKDLYMIQFLFDLYGYAKFPYVTPIVVVVLFICSVYLSLYRLGWAYGSGVIAIFLLTEEVLSQPCLPTSRKGHGFAWGIIISLLICFFTFVTPHVGRMYSIVGYGFFVVIMYNLYYSAQRAPSQLSQSIWTETSKIDMDLLAGVIIKGSVDGLSTTTMESIIEKCSTNNKFSENETSNDSNLRSRKVTSISEQSPTKAMDHECERFRNYWNERCKVSKSTTNASHYKFRSHDENERNSVSMLDDVDWRQVVPVRLCSTCLVDKSRASTHCSVCDVCVVDLDHHCAFVNNCVSASNRKNFFLFTGCATVGCLYYAILAFSLENRVVNNGMEIISVYSYIDVKLNSLVNHPVIFVSKVVAFICVFWIGALFVTQVFFISFKTTTYMVMKGEHRTKMCPMTWNCFKGAVTSLKDFLVTGRAEIRPADVGYTGYTVHQHGPSCDHSHNHDHDHHDKKKLFP